MRFAAVQDYIGRDGRSKTLAYLVARLNARGIVPAILTFSDESDADAFRDIAPPGLRFCVETLPRPLLHLGHSYNQMRLPFLVHDRLAAYDAVFASDTGVYGYPEDLVLIRLVCLPIEQVRRHEERYRRPHYRLWGAALGLVHRALAPGCAFHGTWLAISEFARDRMLESYPLRRDEITVVYAPAAEQPPVTELRRARTVVTLARFQEDKRQLDQIALARGIPNAHFAIAGSTRFSTYYARCVAAAESIPNVELIANGDQDQVDALLAAAKVFLHTKRNEHFGMSTVEATMRGCIPIVHDSGGQREVVPFPELRFTSLPEAAQRLTRALDGEFDSLLPKLQQHMAKFAALEFCNRIDAVLDAAIDSRIQVSA